MNVAVESGGKTTALTGLGMMQLPQVDKYVV
jgi:hypothetical protein